MQNVELVVLTIVGCVLWNLIAFFAFVKRMFPNFWCVVPFVLSLEDNSSPSALRPHPHPLAAPLPLTHLSFPLPLSPRYARGVTLMGDALGHSWVGLLLARALDPQLTTPVPLAFTYKLLVFFVPGSGGKVRLGAFLSIHGGAAELHEGFDVPRNHCIALVS